MTIAYYVSGHGFGHASRSIELMAAIQAKRPDVRVVMLTSVAPWFVERSRKSGFDVQPCQTDTGIVQIDSLRIDEDATAAAATSFYATFADRVDVEAARLRSIGASLVIGDVPPLAFAAAAAAGVPAIAVANFTWDWIYGGYPDFEKNAPGVSALVSACYARASLALRLPLHGGFGPMAPVTRDIPFIARRSSKTKADVRSHLGIDPHRTVVVASFGAYGADLPLRDIEAANDVTLLGDDSLQGLRYEDLVAAADVVVTKPGYGIVSECVANGAALLYTSRGRFVEYDMFVDEMPRYLRCRHIPQEDLKAGRWGEAIRAVLAQPPPPPAPVNGAEVSAGLVLDVIGSVRS
ncbi:MAG TPA: hypothetical protein VHZ73_12600 [Vicinamibacterales bacterium]|jgi:L-arabinokinase|nr:hypothetical protein [Vicinamibacterales bacterium]